MRTYYIFKINTILNPIYSKNKTTVYKILSNINRLNKKEYRLGRKIYKKVIIPLEKDKINSYILSMHINDIYYKKYDNKHYLDSTYEKSEIIINNTYIKIETSNNISTFFKDLYPISNNLFCVDFKNVDYFYIDELKEKSLV